MNAYSELRASGHLGGAGLDLLYKLMRQEIPRRPTLTRRTDRDLDDWVHEFFADKGRAVTAELIAKVHDDDSMARYMRRSVQNWLTDQARKEGTGPLRRQIESALDRGQRYARTPDHMESAGRWHLVGGASTPYGGDLDVLHRAARTVEAAVRLGGSERRPSIRGLTDLLEAVLQAAQGSMEVAQLVAIVARRFPTAIDPSIVTLGSVANGGFPFEEVLADPASSPFEEVLEWDNVDPAIVAVEILDQLSVDHRRVLPVIDDVPALMAALVCGRSTAYTVRARVRELVESACPPDVSHGDVLRELLALVEDTHG